MNIDELILSSETTELTVSLITESWDELSIDWMNKPPHNQEITKLTVASEEIYKKDVTDFISGDSLSICINATSLPTGYVQATSREGHSGTIFVGPKITWTYTEQQIGPGNGIPGYNVVLLFAAIGISIVLIMLKKLKNY